MVKLNVRPPINEVPVEVSADDLDPIIGLDDLDAGRVSGPVGFNSQRITDVAAPLVSTDAATKQYVDTALSVVPRIAVADSARIDLTLTGDTLTADLLAGSVDGSRLAAGSVDDTHLSPALGIDDIDGTRIAGPVDLNAQRIVNLAAPTLDADAATKRYVDRVGRLTYNSATQQIVFTRGDGSTDTASLALSAAFDSVSFDSATNELVFDPAGASPPFRVPLSIDTTALAVTDTSTIDLTLSGDGSTANPYTVAAAIRGGSVVSNHLAAGSVTSVKLAPGLLDFGRVSAGSNVTLTGSGTIADPWVISASAPSASGVQSVTDTASIDLTLTGTALSGVIRPSGVTTAMIADASVTPAKLSGVSLNDLDGTAVTGDVDLNSKKLTNLAAPTAAGDAATKAYVDAAASAGVAVADTATVNLTVTGGVLSAEIPTGAITVTQIGLGAVPTSRLADLAVTSGKIADGAVSFGKLATNIGLNVFDGTRVTAAVDLNSQKIISLAAPTGPNDAATKAYVDTAVAAIPASPVTSTANSPTVNLTVAAGQLTGVIVPASIARSHLSSALAADLDDAATLGGATLAQVRDAALLTGTLPVARLADGTVTAAKLAAGLLDFGKVVAGSNVTVSGAGTAASPYVVNALASGGTTISVTDSSTIDLTLTGSDLTATVKAASIVTGMLAPGVLDFGKVAAGTNSTVSGTGTAADPYKVNVALPSSGVQSVTDTATIDLTLTGTALSASLLAGSVTGAHLAAATVTADKLAPNAVRVTAGTNVTVTGAGTTASPYVVNATGGSAATSLTDLDGTLVAGPVNLNSQRIMALADPSTPTDAANKQYVDTAVAAGSDKVVPITHSTNGVVTLNWALGNVFVLSGVTGNITGFSSINEPAVRHGSIVLVAAATIQVNWTGLNTPGELTATTTLAAGDAATIGIVAGTALPTV